MYEIKDTFSLLWYFHEKHIFPPFFLNCINVMKTHHFKPQTGLNLSTKLCVPLQTLAPVKMADEVQPDPCSLEILGETHRHTKISQSVDVTDLLCPSPTQQLQIPRTFQSFLLITFILLCLWNAAGQVCYCDRSSISPFSFSFFVYFQLSRRPRQAHLPLPEMTAASPPSHPRPHR